MEHAIHTLDQLRAMYGAARERSVKKQLAYLDPHCKRFIDLSPFVVLASSNAQMTMDASPRGGDPGFVKVVGEHGLLIPDASGNNRLDTLENIVGTGQLGLLFMLPGVDETLRVNGTARLTVAPEVLGLFAQDRHPPKLVIEVQVKEAYLHCAKALMRSHLWDATRQLDRAGLPSMGEMMRDQIGGDLPAETQEQMLARYAADL